MRQRLTIACSHAGECPELDHGSSRQGHSGRCVWLACASLLLPSEKGGLIFGALRGEGVATCRAGGSWSAQLFFTLTGGNWGAEILVPS